MGVKISNWLLDPGLSRRLVLVKNKIFPRTSVYADNDGSGWARYYAKDFPYFFIYLIFSTTLRSVIIIISVLQIRKLGFREVK